MLLALAGCAGAEAMTLPAASRAPRPRAPRRDELGLNPGESMAFEVQLGGMLAGEAQLAVGEIGEVDGHRAVVVKSRAATAGAAALIKKIVDEATTVIDMRLGPPAARSTRSSSKGDKTTTAQRDVQRQRSRASRTPAATSRRRTRTSVDFGKVTVHDTHSAMAQLRGWRRDARHDAHGVRRRRSPAVARRRPLRRAARRSARRSATVARFASTARRIARARTSRSSREKPARTFTVWLSDDADRVPLKMIAHTELGDVTMDLTEYIAAVARQLGVARRWIDRADGPTACRRRDRAARLDDHDLRLASSSRRVVGRRCDLGGLAIGTLASSAASALGER